MKYNEGLKVEICKVLSVKFLKGVYIHVMGATQGN